MMSLDDYSQRPSGPPNLSALLHFDDFEVPQYINEYSPTPYLISTTPSPQSPYNTTPLSSPAPQSSCSNIQSSPSSSTDNAPLRNRTCWVYKHMPDIDIGTKYYSTTNKLEWRCKYCTKRYAINGGTRLIKGHLKVDHNISELSTRQERSIKRQISIQNALITATSNPQKRRRLGGRLIISMKISIKLLITYNLANIDYSDFIDQSDVNPDQLEVLLTTLIIECNLPLGLVESPSFKNLLVYLNRQVEPWLPEDHHTIRTWISRQFDFQKQQVKKRLQSSLSCIHITTDLWTSGSDLALLGAIAHFVNPQGDLEEVLIALKEVDGAHTGENLSSYILAAVDDFDITSQLGYFQMDNAPNNDTMIREVSASK
jgi:hypothetical protein